MALTGRPDAAGLVPPDGVIGRMRSLGDPLGIDPLPLLGERAAASGLTRQGSVSCGGSARLLRALDDWIVVNLAREDDQAAVAAWLQVDAVDGEQWALVESVVPTRPATALIEQASLLGLPCARLAEIHQIGPEARLGALPVTATEFATTGQGEPSVIVDLSSLWAGPLCSRLLADTGAKVTKVEATTATRWRTPWSSRVLRASQRRQTVTRARSDDGRRHRPTAEADQPSRCRHRSVPATGVAATGNRGRGHARGGERPLDLGLDHWIRAPARTGGLRRRRRGGRRTRRPRRHRGSVFRC